MMLHSGPTSPPHEPMVMGSPPSPSGYLPGFLMGGDGSFHPASPSLLVSRGGSPLPAARQSLHTAATTAAAAAAASTAAPPRLPNSAAAFASPASAPRKRTPMMRPAPPTNSLWGTPGPAHLHSTPSPDAAPVNRSLFKDCSFGASKPPATPIEAFYTQGRDSFRHDEGLDERWVTVFGYPQKAANFVIEQFSHCGTIVKYRIENEGNWLHIKFQTKLQACKALSKNGKLLTERIMVGVQPCTDKRVMAEDDGAALDASVDTGSFAGVARGPAAVVGGTPGPTPASQASILAEQSFNTSMRSLTARAGGQDTSRLRESEEDTAAKEREGWVNKAFGYVFGWS